MSRADEVRETADREFLLGREQAWQGLKAHHFTLQEFLGMTGDEFKAWTEKRVVPERVMRVWGRRGQV